MYLVQIIHSMKLEWANLRDDGDGLNYVLSFLIVHLVVHPKLFDRLTCNQFEGFTTNT